MYIGKAQKEAMHYVVCPWRHEHTTGADGDSSTVIFDGSDGKPEGFKCLHSHCASKTGDDVRKFFGIQLHRIAKSERGFELVSLKTLFQTPEEEIDYLVENLLISGGNSIVVGRPKSGKTTLVRQLALAIASGKAFLGRKVKLGPVIYVAAEDKRSEVVRHFREMGASGEELIFIHAGPAPKNAFEELEKLINEIRPNLIVLDTLQRIIKVDDGGDYSKVTEAMNPLIDLSHRTQTHILAIHHTKKGASDGEEAVLGSTAFSGTFDSILVVKRNKDQRTLEAIQRYCNDLAPTNLNFDKETRTSSLGETKRDGETSTIKQLVLQLLKSKNKFISQKDLIEELDCRKETLISALFELYKEDKIHRDGKGAKGSPYTYAINNGDVECWAKDSVSVPPIENRGPELN